MIYVELFSSGCAANTIKFGDPDYEDNKRAFYQAFIEEEMSIKYVPKIIEIINKWSKFCGKKQNKYCEKLPMPTGVDKTKIVDAFEDSDKSSKESLPLSPSMLELQKTNFKENQYKWYEFGVCRGFYYTNSNEKVRDL